MSDFFAGAIFLIFSILFLGYLFPDHIGLVVGSLTAGLFWALADRMFRGK